jgi:uncharacterized protein YifE (UPF0438 family)
MSDLVNLTKKALLATALLSTLVGCNGGGGSGYGAHNSYNVSAQGFVNALNDVDGTYDNELMLDTYETMRTYNSSEDWFVIWDQANYKYVGVSLQYIRSVTYYDYYSNNYALADEFRYIQDDDMYYNYNGRMGDGNGYDYEELERYGNDYYGLDSGEWYEDEEETFDVSLMAAEAQKKKFFKKASAMSAVYNVDIKTSMALVTLGTKVEGMLNKSQGEMTEADQLAVMGDLQKLTGASLADINEAAEDAQKKEVLLETIAKKIGTSTDNLENRLLPELFGLSL